MKAVVLREFGDVDKLVYENYPKPKIGPDEVLVAVKACGVNRLDLWIRSGTHPPQIPLPHIVGAEIAGNVAEVGEAVKHVRAGQPVAIAPYLFCGHCEFFLSGREESCEKIRIIGREIDGGYAEFVREPVANIIELPSGMSYSAAAGVTLATLTSWHMLVSRAQIRAGEIVLVLAAGSGVGSAAIQIAKLSGCRVIATSSRDEHLEHARDLGADELINYQNTDFLSAVLELTQGRGVDIVFEHVGGWTHGRRAWAVWPAMDAWSYAERPLAAKEGQHLGAIRAPAKHSRFIWRHARRITNSAEPRCAEPPTACDPSRVSTSRSIRRASGTGVSKAIREDFVDSVRKNGTCTPFRVCRCGSGAS